MTIERRDIFTNIIYYIQFTHCTYDFTFHVYSFSLCLNDTIFLVAHHQPVYYKLGKFYWTYRFSQRVSISKKKKKIPKTQIPNITPNIKRSCVSVSHNRHPTARRPRLNVNRGLLEREHLESEAYSNIHWRCNIRHSDSANSRRCRLSLRRRLPRRRRRQGKPRMGDDFSHSGHQVVWERKDRGWRRVPSCAGDTSGWRWRTCLKGGRCGWLWDRVWG